MKAPYWICLLLPLHMAAQNTSTGMSSVGVFGETNSMSASSRIPSISTVGLLYQKKFKKHLYYSVAAGYSKYTNTNEQYKVIIGFTGNDVACRFSHENVNLCILSIGAGWEHALYKKLYFFTGIDVRFGYGSGTTDTTYRDEYWSSVFNPQTGKTQWGMVSDTTWSPKRGPENIIYAGLSPYFGLKLEFKRFSVGTMFLNYVTFRDISAGGYSSGNIDFDFGNITQRVFLNYKF